VIFTETDLRGAFIIEPEKIADERGYFARTWCQEEFSRRGLTSQFIQGNISSNTKKGTLRGMHYQVHPHEEVKLVRCTQGAIYDVIIDLRPGSPTFKKWMAVELTAENYLALYIPEKFAHGFQTLVDNTEVFYQMSGSYHPDYGRGIRWNDPAFGIEWPSDEQIISARDQEFPDFIP